MNSLHAMVADDESPKLNSVVEFLENAIAGISITKTRSVRSTIDVLKRVRPDILVLDMSLPTFDVGPGEKGGRPQNLGGEEVLRYMEFYELSCPVIIITQYDHFSDNGTHIPLAKVAERLHLEHPANFKGIIHYGGSTSTAWRTNLKEALEWLKHENSHC
jgi:CheY-like chemotaxis protein